MAKVLDLQLQHQSFQWIFSTDFFFKIDWFDLLAVQGTLKSLLQHHSSKASILWRSAFFMVQLSCPSTRWCHQTISSYLQTFPTLGSFLMSQLFTSGGQSTGSSTSTSVLSMNIQGWFPLRLTGLITLLSRGFSRVFSNTTVQKYQFIGAQPSLWFSSHICTWLLERP